MKTRTIFSPILRISLIVVFGQYGCKNHPDIRSAQSTISTIITDSVKPELFISQKKINIGKVKSDTTIQGAYTLYNHGNKTLEIEYINPDCTCTGFSLTKKQIKPGDSSLLILKMSTKDKEGNTSVHATIGANTATRLYQVTLTANVIQ